MPESLVLSDTIVAKMVTTQEIAELVAAYLDGHPYATRYWRGVHWTRPRPSTEEAGAALLVLAEQRALDLGAFLRTPEGEVVEAGVAMVVPPAYAVDFRMLVDALTWASREQQRVGRERAGKFALAAAAVIALFVIFGN